MPVYNAEKFLTHSIQSVLDQSFTNFEFLIFNDGSTDNSAAIINSFNDERIKCFHFSDNRGYVHHLNAGIKIARGKYIARMDADDLSLQDRFKKQVEFLEMHTEFGICGTQIVLINDEGTIIERPFIYEDDDNLRLRLLVNSCFAHPTVMIRKSIISGNGFEYDFDLMPAEDYALWYRISTKTKLTNLPEILLQYRMHSGQITQLKQKKQHESISKIRSSILRESLKFDFSDREFVLHNSLLNNSYSLSREYVIDAKKWLLRLVEQNRRLKTYNQNLFENKIKNLWFSLCTHSYKLGFWILLTYFFSGVLRGGDSFSNHIKFLLKSLFRFSPFKVNGIQTL